MFVTKKGPVRWRASSDLVSSAPVRSIGSTSIHGVDADGACVDAIRPDSGTGLDADGEAAGVGPDPVADPEGPACVKGEPAHEDPVGVPLDSMGPKGAPVGAVTTKILLILSRYLLFSEGEASGPREGWMLRLGV